MKLAATRRSLIGLFAGLVAMVATIGGCASDVVTGALPVGTDIAPRASCSAGAAAPQFISTAPAMLPATVYDREWATRIAFRVDERGFPEAIDVTIDGERDDADTLTAAVGAAFAGYRFCAPVAYSAATRWTAVLRFRPLRSARATHEPFGFVQMFVPAYTRDEVRAGHAGTVRVAATFADDGRPRALRLVSSSGDAVLDRKSLDAISSWQLVVRPGSAQKTPLTLEQSYTYVLR